MPCPSTEGREQRRVRVGFTLVELLVTMAIISIIAAMLLPVLRAAVETGRTIKCESNLRQLGLLFVHYQNDNSNLWPAPRTSGYWHINGLWPYTTTQSFWPWSTRRLKVRETIFVCPKFKTFSSTDASLLSYGMKVGLPTNTSADGWGVKEFRQPMPLRIRRP